MGKLSVIISAYNEEKNIEDCLKSVRFADEVILVDNDSSDETVAIAKKYTPHILHRKNNPMLNINKNYGMSQAKGDWLLSLDADERVTEPLQKEIKKVIEQDSSINGYWIPRKNILFKKWIQNSIWWPDYQLRLIRKGKGKFPEKHVHEYIEITGDGDTEKLSEPLVHENYTSISQYLYKLDKIYTESEVENFISSGKRIFWTDAIRFPARDFLKTFFAEKGYRDGLHGLVLSMLQAFYAEIVFAKIWERQGFQEENSKDFLNNFFKESKRLALEFRYWMFSSRIDESKSRYKKVGLRVLRRSVSRKIKKHE